MQNRGDYYITTAITYASGKPHIGNTYEAILADAIARFKRNQGYNVFLQTGTDEHGQKIEEKAAKSGKTPQVFVDETSAVIKSLWDMMNVKYDKFMRTTDPYHKKQVQKMFKKFYEQGDIYKGAYEGWYCVPCESFWTDSQLVDGKCPDCGREVEKAKEEAYFFKMSKYAPALIKYIEDHPGFITPVSRKNEMMNNFLKPGLQDLCVSRTSFKWGVPVDFDDKHVVYVWLDALSNYITGIGYDVDGNSDEKFKKFWPADVHIIGKDIIRFHTIYWPIFLMALGLPLPKKVFGHAWLVQEGGKMSKSKGNVIYADDLVKYFGVDPVRYFALTAMPFDNDGIVEWDVIIEKINSDLANVYGNLVNRTIAMSNKYFGGIVENTGVSEAVDEDLKACATSCYAKVAKNMDEYRIADAIGEIISLCRRANKYIDETTPWVLAKNEDSLPRLKTVLYNLTETITIATSLLQPFMPDSCANILGQLNTQMRDYDDLDKFGLYQSGNKVTDKPSILFARLDAKEILESVQKMYDERKTADKKSQNAEKEEKVEEITIDDFCKTSLKVAKVLECEKVQKSKKLLKLILEIGEEKRQVVSGIAEYYTPEEMVGKKVILVCNLKPCKLCGVESQGMILCAEKDGVVKLVAPEVDMPSGSVVR